MKKKYLIPGLMVLSILAIGIGSTAALASNSSSTAKFMGRMGAGRPDNAPELSTAQKAEMDVKFAAVKTAISSGNYSAWVSAQTAIDSKCPLLEKITADNFSKYAEAVSLRDKSDSIMEELGIERGEGQGMGRGGFGHGRGRGNAATDTE